MHRIDHPTADVTDPLKPLYTEGNPTLGVPATCVTDDWLNDVQENIMKVIEEGGVTPTKGNDSDLLDAIQALATGGDMYKADNLSGLADNAAARANLGVLGFKGTSIPSAATTNIGNADSHFVDITGTTTITSLGTGTERNIMMVNFTGALTLTHNATSLILPGGANITTAAGDTAIFARNGASGSGNWRCIAYQRFSGKPIVETQAVAALTYTVASGTLCPSYTVGAWRTILLNTENFDPDGIVTLSSNQFTLSPGRYKLSGGAYFNRSAGGKANKFRFYNITDSVVLFSGLNFRMNNDLQSNHFPIEGFIDIAGTKTIELQIYPAATSLITDSEGTDGSVEIYSFVNIQKVG